MKKLSKRFLTLAIACVMAMMMAVPAFAIGNPTVSSGRYKIYPNRKTTFLLNVRGYGNENDNVTLYTPTNGNDQVWKTIATSYGGFYVVSALSNTQGLNIYHGTNNQPYHKLAGLAKLLFNLCLFGRQCQCLLVVISKFLGLGRN